MYSGLSLWTNSTDHIFVDLLIALAQALGKIATSAPQEPLEGEFLGIHIVLATKNGKNRPTWEDQTSIPRFKYRLKRIMLGLPFNAGGLPVEKSDEALTKYLRIRRVGADNRDMYSHSKVSSNPALDVLATDIRLSSACLHRSEIDVYR